MNSKFKIIAGPCLAESFEMMNETASKLVDITKKYDVEFFFKASYRKANRTSSGSFQGVGDEIALNWLKEISIKYDVNVLTDVHTAEEAKFASQFVNALQIPAFLSRQTDLLVAAAETGLHVNIKKGQFMAPDDMKKAAGKITDSGNDNVWLTERGNFFGYHDLVVDMRGMLEMKKFGFPVIYDATHSLQKPSIGEQSGGLREYVKPLAFAAVSLNIDGIFFETHPDPNNAKSDSATQLFLKDAEQFIDNIMLFNELTKKVNNE